MLMHLVFMSLLFMVGACSRYHERQGYIPLSSVQEFPTIDPSSIRLKEINALAQSKQRMEAEEGVDLK